MHVVWEGGKPRIVPGIIPTITGFPTRGLPVIAILLPDNLLTASPLYLHVLGKEKRGAIDKSDGALEIRDIDVLFIELDLLTRHHRGGSEELQDCAIVLSCGHVRCARMVCFRLQICFPCAAAYQSNHSGCSPRVPASKRSRNVSVLIP
jgi:hypothetical protein